MKKYIQKAVLICGYLLLIGSFTGLKIEELFDLKEVFLVVIGGILLTLPYIAEKENRRRLLEIAGNNGMISSYMVTFVLILGRIEQMQAGETMMQEILMSLRPILYGFAMLVLLKSPENKAEKSTDSRIFFEPVKEDAVKQEKILHIGESGQELRFEEIAKEKEPIESQCKNLGLTAREAEIVKLVLAGLSNREIGEQLYIAESTVKKHMSNIFEKLGVQNREQLKQRFR